MQISGPIPKLELRSLMQVFNRYECEEMVTIEDDPFKIAASRSSAGGRRLWGRIKPSTIHNINNNINSRR